MKHKQAMNLKIMKYLIITLIICSCASNRSSTINNNEVADNTTVNERLDKQQDYLIIAFEEAIRSTSFTALIEHYKIESFPIEDLDKNDDFTEKKILFYANVIETYSGKHKDKIVYEMIVDINEDEIFNKEPILICLCEKEGILYWAGTGSIFPNKQKLINKANEIKTRVNKEKNKSNCFD